MTNENAERIARARSWRKWFGIPGLVALGFLFGYFVSRERSLDAISLPLSMILFAGVLWFVFRPRGYPQQKEISSRLLFGVIWLALTVGCALGTALRIHPEREAVARIVTLVESVLTHEAGEGQPGALSIDAPRTAGVVGAKEQVMREIAAKAISLQNDRASVLQATGIDNLLDPQRILSDEGMVEAKRVLQATRLSNDEYEKKYQDVLESVPERLRQVETTEADRLDMLQAYERGASRQREQNMQFWKLERESVDAMEDLIEFLESRRGHWSISGGRFQFPNARDEDAASALIERIQQISDQEAKLQQEHADYMRAGLARISR